MAYILQVRETFLKDIIEIKIVWEQVTGVHIKTLILEN
jgi:hypothetical protein